MNIDTDHLHYWMQAIRQSTDPMRTMDAFWSGQIKSKEWLISCLTQYVNKPVTIDIHGGWVGTLASLLFQSSLPIKHINSIDIDPCVNSIAINMNKLEEIEGRFQAFTADMCNTHSVADIIINTSCEHITQEQYNTWLKNQPTDSILLVQSNNYDIPEHIRTASSLDHFVEQSNLDVSLAVELTLPLYKRFMIIGKK
jgi:hypothetical protein